MADIGQSSFRQPWVDKLGLTGITTSLAVNVLATGLIVFKIFKVYWEVKPLYDQPFGRTGGSKLRPLIFIIIESDLALFSIRLAWLVINLDPTEAAAVASFYTLSSCQQNLKMRTTIYHKTQTSKYALLKLIARKRRVHCKLLDNNRVSIMYDNKRKMITL